MCIPVDAVGWEFEPRDSHVMKLLRVTVLKAASGVPGLPAVTDTAKAKFALLGTDYGSVHPELRDLVMNAAVATGGKPGGGRGCRPCQCVC